MVEEVKEKITEAFHHFNKKDGIEMSSIRIKIFKQNGGLGYVLMNKTEDVRETEFDEMISGLGFLVKPIAKNQLKSSVEKVIAENDLSDGSANIRVYPAKDNSPLVHLFNDNKAIKAIEIEKLLN